MPCPRCGKRKARRACPALGREICAVCCATERQVSIACPADCGYLESAQRHPAAAVRRQQDHDLALILGALGRVSERQLQLFFLIQTVVARFRPEGLARLIDADVAAAMAALAGTFETRATGLVYEHRAEGSTVAEALRLEVAALLDELAKGGGSRFDREASVVLRGIERGARHQPEAIGTDETAYLTVVARVMQLPPAEAAGPADGKSTIVLP
ncbi:MAG: hypothetical protein AB7H88_22125 [Vicinamibacterales bacterium]